MITELASILSAAAAVPDPARAVVWIVDGDGPSLSSVDLASGALTRHAALPSVPSGIALSHDAASLLIAGTDGTLIAIPGDDPAGGALTTISSSPDVFAQAAATHPKKGQGSAVVVSIATAQLLAFDLASQATSSLVSAPGLSGVATARGVWAAHTTGGVGSVSLVRAGAFLGGASGLLATGHLTIADGDSLLLVAHPADARVSAIAMPGGTVTTHATDAVAGALVEVHKLADGRFLVVTTEKLVLVDDLAELTPRPRLAAPTAPLFVGSWVPLSYDLSGSALSPAEVSFVVPDGPDAGIVSHSRTDPDPSAEPVPLLIAGGRPGTYEVAMVETATNAVLDNVKFEVSDHWHDPEIGPSRCYVGATAPAPAGDWGGGPGTPQNVNTKPHSGTWRAAVLLVNTADGAYPSDAAGLAAARTSVLNEVQDGVAVGTTTRSARHYYEEISRYDPATGKGLTVRARNNQVYGPITLPGGWGAYFTQKMDDAGNVIDDRWSSFGSTVQTIISTAISQGILTTADFSAIDVLIIVPFSPDATGPRPARFVWPHAHDALPFLAGTNVMTDQRSFAYAFAPPDFEVHDGRRVHATLSHELGHTLGLPDLYDFPSYSPDVRNRIIGGWDMMSGSSNNMPHYSLSNRMRMGWVDSSHLKLYNFQGSGGVNENTTLHAAELGAPPAGRVRGIEIRLGDGWNYYVEYRAQQPTQLGDTLPADRRVVITDVTSDSFVAPTLRPPIIKVVNDVDGDGPILDINGDFEDTDPGTQMQLLVTVVSTAADNAVVNVKYGSNGRPDPGIRPWTGAPNWQSPDIEIRNAKTIADPARWFNTPWIAHPNTVVAKVRNNGDLLATGVKCDFFVIQYSSGDGPMVPLGTDTHNIAPGATVEFTTTWVPPANHHYCIIARLRLYQDPALPTILETNIYNNEARSNYTTLISASASPSSRTGAEIQLANPFDASTLVTAVVRQAHPLHRVFLDHQWLRVDGRSSRPIRVFDEALLGFPEFDELGGRESQRRVWKVPNLVSVDGWAQRPFQTDCGAQSLTGGVAIRVWAGRATRVDIRRAARNAMSGRVTHVDDGSPCASGVVLIVVQGLDVPGEEFTVTTQVTPDGTFSVDWQNRLRSVKQAGAAHYLGANGSAASESKIRRLDP